MAKPTTYPRWADVGGDIVEPTSGKKDVGWVSDEEPPAQYFNWLLNLLYQWVVYLDASADREEEVSLAFPGSNGTQVTADWSVKSSSAGDWSLRPLTATAEYTVRVSVEKGRRLKTINLYCMANNGASLINLYAYSQSLAPGSPAGAPALLGSAVTSGVASANIQKISITGLTTVAATNSTYMAKFTADAASANLQIYSLTFTTDKL